jgi:hypothetical protein
MSTPGAQPVRLELTADFILVYAFGCENDPSNPFGRCTLTLYADGRLELDNRARGQAHAWTATIDGRILADLIKLLDSAGFPVVPPHQIPPGATRSLLVRIRGQQTQTPLTGFHEARKMPGYGEAYHLLDSLVVGASDGALKVVRDPLTGLVRGTTASGPTSAVE